MAVLSVPVASVPGCGPQAWAAEVALSCALNSAPYTKNSIWSSGATLLKENCGGRRGGVSEQAGQV